ncbi:MAG TPA: PDZ domain-containing protein [Longimicrobiales bacterium]|nr:PDZ domain-containing protein [Longimicrobiales bacterium]
MTRRMPVLTLVLALCATPATAQQQPRPPSTMEVTVSAARGWYGFAYATVPGPAGSTEMVVQSVVDGSPAARAGLRVGDRITRLEGQPISVQRLTRIGQRVRPGEGLVARVRRGGSERDVRLVAEPTPGRLVLRGPGGSTAVTVRPDSVLQVMELLLDSMGSAVARFRFHDVAPSVARLERAAGWIETDSGRIYVLDERGRPFDLQDRMAEAQALTRMNAEGVIALQAMLRAQRERTPSVRELERLSAVTEEGRSERLAALARTRSVEGRRIRELEEAARSGARGGVVSVAREPVHGAWVTFGEKAVAGARFEEIGPQWRHAFGVERGLMVIDVAPGTLAARAGLRPSDVVIGAGGSAISTVAELRARLEAAGRDGVAIEVVREKKRRALRLPGR